MILCSFVWQQTTFFDGKVFWYILCKLFGKRAKKKRKTDGERERERVRKGAKITAFKYICTYTCLHIYIYILSMRSLRFVWYQINFDK